METKLRAIVDNFGTHSNPFLFFLNLHQGNNNLKLFYLFNGGIDIAIEENTVVLSKISTTLGYWTSTLVVSVAITVTS